MEAKIIEVLNLIHAGLSTREVIKIFGVLKSFTAK